MVQPKPRQYGWHERLAGKAKPQARTRQPRNPFGEAVEAGMKHVRDVEAFGGVKMSTGYALKAMADRYPTKDVNMDRQPRKPFKSKRKEPI